LDEKVASQVAFEISQIDQLLAAYAELWERAQENTPDLVEMTAMASVLHSFYNGLENIFLSIAKGLDQGVPSGAQWHRDLLVQMTQGATNRPSVISSGLAQKLADYLGFRHFYRHSYSFFLDWNELKNLVRSLPDVWDDTRKALQDFLDSVTE
jgi:ribonuclease HepT-like protein